MMSKPAMSDNPHCRLHVHCRACRDRSAGRELRRQWGLRFGLPDGEVDFACVDPLELRPWGYAGTPAPFPIPDGAVAVCLACERLRACPAVLLCRGCGGRADAQIVGPCPGRKW